MLTVFFATLDPMLVLFMCMVIGFLLNKLRLLPENSATVLSKLENYVLLPALTFNTFMKYCTVASLKEKYMLMLYSTIAVLIAIAIAYLLSGFFTKGEYQKNIYRYALTFGNCGFMGNAIVPAILGEKMLYEYLLFTMPLNLAIYTWGLTILIPKGETRKNPLKNLLNPTVFAIALGMICGLLGIEKYVPSFFTTAIGNLSSCMGPVAMLLAGFVVGNYSIVKLLKNVKVYIATFLRLFVLPAFFVGLLFLLKADKMTLTLALFAFETPLGLNTIVFPAAYGGETETGASMAMISHTLCVLTIPLMYSLFSLIFK